MTKTPKLRFPGFTDAWEQDKVSKLMVRVSEISDTTDIPTIEYEDVVSGSGSLIPGYERKETNKKGIIFQNGDVLFGKLRPYLKNWLLAEFDGKAVGDWWVLHSEKLNSEFQYSLIQNSQFQEVANISTGTKMPRSDWKLVSEVKLFFPTLPEQEAIGAFFRQLDELLTLHQRKLDEVKNLKKSLLQKMFPKNGERIPEVRFPEFTAAWEQRKLGEVAEVVGGGTPSTSIQDYWDGDIDWYSPAEIGNQIFLKGSQKKITELGIQSSSAKILPVGTVLFTSRAGIGNTAILTKEGATNQGFQSIVPNIGKLNSYFIFSRTDELKKYGETQGAGSTFVEVSGKQMSKMPISLPPLPEQEAIGAFFRQLDELLTLHQRKLEHLQSLKRALLQQMFI
ncbi:restriction endonuclease subunit S [Streptococcus mutans]|uniref:restriction endonuclease subunit S n=2 Tax=Streptococcus mutans TaxID=1309 RepID=UPI001455BC48|nr:restriction endonuclease subunit S [Streptococcus mutans]NLQ88646.1 restriction endonuclease subunit S [Streptococcus mutans]